MGLARVRVRDGQAECGMWDDDGLVTLYDATLVLACSVERDRNLDG